ncbi:hypothetical protein [Klebsiella phage KP8]|uniref:Uncharacterized protein n=1 Tax=Klebsiella phage KP8 TaxID=2099850 RepID=A0A2P1CCQ4_9CAUD|nr:hypothetical protein HWB55_gp078 [Klebsiella phage KP8]AVJ48991.1 hypothetical protein [Klebsiella phage KP8]
MQIDYEIVGSKLVCTGTPEDWIGSQIQVIMDLSEYSTQDEAKAAGAELITKRYLDTSV